MFTDVTACLVCSINFQETSQDLHGPCLYIHFRTIDVLEIVMNFVITFQPGKIGRHS